MMTAATKLSLEQFLALPEGDITYELKEGKAIAKMSPKRFHSRLAVTLCVLLENWSKERGEAGEPLNLGCVE